MTSKSEKQSVTLTFISFLNKVAYGSPSPESLRVVSIVYPSLMSPCSQVVIGHVTNNES